jgi:hypothetical protein
MEDDAMKPKDVPQEWVEMAWGAYGTAAVGDMHAALAAVAPLIRRAALEEAAGVAENRHLGWVFPHPDDARPGEVCDDATACADIAAAIRALDT